MGWALGLLLVMTLGAVGKLIGDNDRLTKRSNLLTAHYLVLVDDNDKLGVQVDRLQDQVERLNHTMYGEE